MPAFNSISRVCQTCSKEFLCKPSRLREGRGKFCSRLCAGTSRLKTITCEQCHQPFQPGHQKSLYCSRDCQARSRQRRLTRSCLYCGRDFTIQRAVAEKGEGKYCSRQCCDTDRKQSPESRFWKYVIKPELPDACWDWKGHKDKKGYGYFGIDGINTAVYRFSWELHNGPIPDGLCVLHDCPGGDNPGCANPRHLWLGTKTDNAQDMVKKDRQAKGEQSGQSKLTASQVLAIRALTAQGIRYKIIAAQFQIYPGYVGEIHRRKSWKHLTSEEEAS